MTDWKQVNENWKKITEVYESLFGIPQHIIEYVAVYDYALLAVSGKSNKEILSIHPIQEEELVIDFQEFLGFEGWKESLDINPLFTYRAVGGIESKFVNACKADSKKISLNEINIAYDICKRFIGMEKSINDSYY